MKKDFIIGIFDDEEKLIHGAEKLRDKNITIYDFYTPFPVHGLDELLGIKRSVLPYVTFIAGFMGMTMAMSYMIWTSAIDWPTVIGGKPFASIPAFIPVTFEVTIFCAAHITVLAFLFINRLFPGQKPVIFDKHQTDYSFVLCIEKDKANFDDVASILKEHGAMDVKLSEQDIK